MKPLRKLRHVAEYLGLRAGLSLVESLPAGACDRIVCGLADCAFFLHRAKRRTAIGNVRQAGLASSEAAVRHLARESFRHVGRVAVESIRFGKLATEETWRKYIDLVATPETRQALAAMDRPAIFAGGHVGNWEIAARVLNFIRPVAVLVRDMNNPYTNRLVRNRTARNSYSLVSKQGAGKSLLSQLRKGGAVAILADQHARTGGVMIDFFGKPASTYSAPVRLQHSSGADVFVGGCFRTGLMRYCFEIRGPVEMPRTGDRQRDVEAGLKRLAQELETDIRNHPHQYLWAHRRWR